MKEQIKSILLENFIELDDPSELTDDLALVSGGLLDSISILQLVDMLEKTFKIDFEAHEIDREKFDSISLIEQLVSEKIK